MSSKPVSFFDIDNMIMFLTIPIALSVTLFIYAFYQTLSLKTPAFINFPFVGMLPQFLLNVSNIHEYSTQMLTSKGGTVEFLGPWFTNMKSLITLDPLNVHHIMSKSFSNFVKGDLFRETFRPFGEGIFTTDSFQWKYHRNLLQFLFKNRSFEAFQEKIIHNKVAKSLIPLLDHVQQSGLVVDLQDVFNRFTFDNICLIVLGHDPICLSTDFPEVAVEKAFNQAEESIFVRHTVPAFVWRLQNYFEIGEEKKMIEACKVFDQFLYDCIARKREELLKNGSKNEIDVESDENHRVDLLTAMIREEQKNKGSENELSGDKFLRDSVFNLFVAGRDTITSALSWFFYLVATNPLVEKKILEEIKEKFGHKEKPWILSVDEVKSLVYLHGAICEALRLFPPVPFERKETIEHDILPSGHHVHPKTMIFFSLYAMGRSEDIWGKDYLEFKPERWISERGGIVYAPSYKFFSFNAGPRTCLGRDLAFIQVKMVAASILWNYCVHVVEGNIVTPSLSIVLLMKHGLKVKITKRAHLI